VLLYGNAYSMTSFLIQKGSGINMLYMVIDKGSLIGEEVTLAYFTSYDEAVKYVSDLEYFSEGSNGFLIQEVGHE